MKRIFKKMLNAVVFLFTFRGDTADRAVDDGCCDFSGQGRDKKRKVRTGYVCM